MRYHIVRGALDATGCQRPQARSQQVRHPQEASRGEDVTYRHVEDRAADPPERPTRDPRYAVAGAVTSFINKLMTAARRARPSASSTARSTASEQQTGRDAARRLRPGDAQRDAGARSEAAARRWCDLPGAGRHPQRAPPGPGDALAARLGAAPAVAVRWPRSSPASCWTRPTTPATAIKRQEDTHRMAEANRAFVHYRW